MKRAQLISILWFLCLLFACTKGEPELDCIGQADRPVDVLTGPPPRYFGARMWAFLSNEYGGRSNAVDAGTYPLFLNWEGGCQEEYAVNLLEYYGAESILTTFWKFPVGESVNLNPIFSTSTSGFTEVGGRTITITNLSGYRNLKFVPALAFEDQFDPDARTLRIDIEVEDRWRGGRYAYLTFFDEVLWQNRAILIDLEQGQEYDYLIQSVEMSWQQITFPEGTSYVLIQEVIDPTTGETVEMSSGPISDEEGNFLLIKEPRAHLIYAATAFDIPYYRRQQEYYPALPETVDFPSSPIVAHDYQAEFFSLTTTDPIILRVTADHYSNSGTQERVLRGVIPMGEHRLRSPGVPPRIQEQFPRIDLPLNLSDSGYRITLSQFPAATTAADYWRMDELGWLAEQRYYYERIVVEK